MVKISPTGSKAVFCCLPEGVELVCIIEQNVFGNVLGLHDIAVTALNVFNQNLCA